MPADFRTRAELLLNVGRVRFQYRPLKRRP